MTTTVPQYASPTSTGPSTVETTIPSEDEYAKANAAKQGRAIKANQNRKRSGRKGR